MKPPRAYAPHEDFIAPARAYPQFWRFLAGFVLASVAYVFLARMYFRLLYACFPRIAPVSDSGVVEGNTPLDMYALLLSFAFMTLGAAISARLLHHRGLGTLLGPAHLLLRDFRRVSLVVLAVGAVILLLPPWDMGGELVPNMPIGKWILLLAPSLLFVLIQVSAEEVVFRGYVQQQLAARFRHPLVWMVLPSVLFASGHYLPDVAGDNALLIVVWAGVFGILMADLTARSGSLGPAIAVHFWNNVSAMLIVSLPDEMSGLALYLSPFSMADTEALREWMFVDFAMMFVLWLAARLAIRR